MADLVGAHDGGKERREGPHPEYQSDHLPRKKSCALLPSQHHPLGLFPQLLPVEEQQLPGGRGGRTIDAAAWREKLKELVGPR